MFNKLAVLSLFMVASSSFAAEPTAPKKAPSFGMDNMAQSGGT